VTVGSFYCSACLTFFGYTLAFYRSTEAFCFPPCFSPLGLPKKAAKMQFSLMTRTPLEAFLQNRRNFSPSDGLKAIIGQIGALLPLALHRT
jgi:hypothetical protein